MGFTVFPPLRSTATFVSEMPFAQLVIGPPGSGKTTYCHGLHQFLTAIDRSHVLLNLDPANDHLPYPASIQIQDLISVETVMNQQHLGPNGALMYSMQYIDQHLQWLVDRIKAIPQWQDLYFIVDAPGQVELQTLDPSLKNIVQYLEKHLNFRWCATHLVDASHCTDASRFISVLVVSLQAMLHLELPHVNVLSKLDLLSSKGSSLDFGLDFYTEAVDLKRLVQLMDQQSSSLFGDKFKKLNEALCELIEDFSLVGFYTLSVEDKELMARLLRVIDKANGYVYGGLHPEGNNSIQQIAARVGGTGSLEEVNDVQERYLRNEEANSQPGH